MDGTGMRNILITGGNGFTGIHACQHFLRQGYRVVSTRRLGDPASGERICDMTKKAEVDQILKDVQPDYILHLAGKNHAGESWGNPELFMKANVDGTLHLLESARNNCPQARILVIGSALEICPVHDKPTHPYSYSKTMQTFLSMAWHHLYQANLSVVKPPNLIGPGPSTGVCAQFARNIAKGMKQGSAILEINSSSLPRTYLDVRDAVTAYEDILVRGRAGVVYELDGGKRSTLEKLANIYEEIADCPIIIKKKIMREEKEKNLSSRGKQIFGDVAQKWTINPKYSLKQSLVDTLNYFQLSS